MDFIIRNDSESTILIPESDRAKQWILDNLQVKDWQTILNGIIIESYLVYDIIEVLIVSGLSILAFNKST
jgi:hypothetical protein